MPYPDIIGILPDAEYYALGVFMASPSAPIAFVTLKDALDVVMQFNGVEPDSPRYAQFVGVWQIEFYTITIEGEELTAAVAVGLSGAFYTRYLNPPDPDPRYCPPPERWPYPARHIIPRPPCR